MRNVLTLITIEAVFCMCCALTLPAPQDRSDKFAVKSNDSDLTTPANGAGPENRNEDEHNGKGTLEKNFICSKRPMMEEVEEWDHIHDCQNITTLHCTTKNTTEYKLEKRPEKCMVEYRMICNPTFKDKYITINVKICNETTKECHFKNSTGICSIETVHCETTYQEYEVVEMAPGCSRQIPFCAFRVKDSEKCSFLPASQFCADNNKVTKKVIPTRKCKVMPKEVCGPEGCPIEKVERKCRMEKIKGRVEATITETCELVPIKTSKKCTDERPMVQVPYLTTKDSCSYVPEKLCNITSINPRVVMKKLVKRWCGPADYASDYFKNSSEIQGLEASPCSKLCTGNLLHEDANNNTIAKLCSDFGLDSPDCEELCPAVISFAHRLKGHLGHLTPISYCDKCAAAGCAGSLSELAACVSSRGICKSVTRITETSPTCRSSACDVACKDSPYPEHCRKCFKAGCTDKNSNLAACAAFQVCTVG